VNAGSGRIGRCGEESLGSGAPEGKLSQCECNGRQAEKEAQDLSHLLPSESTADKKRRKNRSDSADTRKRRESFYRSDNNKDEWENILYTHRGENVGGTIEVGDQSDSSASLIWGSLLAESIRSGGAFKGQKVRSPTGGEF